MKHNNYFISVSPIVLPTNAISHPNVWLLLWKLHCRLPSIKPAQQSDMYWKGFDVVKYTSAFHAG